MRKLLNDPTTIHYTRKAGARGIFSQAEFEAEKTQRIVALAEALTGLAGEKSESAVLALLTETHNSYYSPIFPC
jgi:hypothetical protein